MSSPEEQMRSFARAEKGYGLLVLSLMRSMHSNGPKTTLNGTD